MEEGTKTVDTLATLMLTGCTTHQIAEIIMQCLPLRNVVKCLLLNDVNEQCQKLCYRSAENSCTNNLMVYWASVESKMHSGFVIN